MGSVAPGRPLGLETLAGRELKSGALSRLLFDAAVSRPSDLAFRDGPGREKWCDRPPLRLSNEVATEAVRRLSLFLRRLGLEPGSAVGVWLPNGTEAALSIVAIEDAGLTPCVIAITATAGQLSSAIQAADLRALVTQSRFGPDLLAGKACFVAAGFFRLRHLLAFGPDVPDGVVDLDPILLAPRSSETPVVQTAPSRPAGLITLQTGSNGAAPVHWPWPALIGGAEQVVREAKIEAAHRVLTFSPPDDLEGVTAGLIAALVAGATLEAHTFFESDALLETLAKPGQSHLVAPGSLEDALVEGGVVSAVTSTILVHRAPASLGAAPPSSGTIVDLLSFGETGFLVAARTEAGGAGGLLGSGFASGLPGFFEAFVNDDDQVCVRSGASAFQGGSGASSDEWHLAGFLARRSGDRVVALSSVGP